MIFKYRMYVQARTDLTEEEVKRYLDSGKKSISPSVWPWRDTGEFVYARRKANAKAFYAALRGVKPPVKVKAQYVSGKETSGRNDAVSMRAWRGFVGVTGSINGAADEVRHYSVGQKTACGLEFDEFRHSVGKPECPICLAAAVKEHPEMEQYL